MQDPQRNTQRRGQGRWLDALRFAGVCIALAGLHAGTARAQPCQETVVHTKELDAYYGTASGAGMTLDGLALSATITSTLADQIIATYPDARVTENINDFVDNTTSDQQWVLSPPDNFPAQQNLMEDLSTIPSGFTVSFSAPELVTTQSYFVAFWTTFEDDLACPNGLRQIDHVGDASVNYYELNGTIEEPQWPLAFANTKMEIEEDEFEVKTTFTLGTGSDGIDPLSEEVSLQVGPFATTIPAGSFRFTPARRGRPAQFKFKGVIDGVALEVVIQPVDGRRFKFEAEGEGADLSGTVNPVTVRLTIGDDGGSTTVRARFE